MKVSTCANRISINPPLVFSISLLLVSLLISINPFYFDCLASMEIFPKEALVPFDAIASSINLSCTVREVSSQPIDPTRIKWYQNDKELESVYLIDRYSHRNQATSMVSIPSGSLKDESNVFKCLYDNGKASKDVRLMASSTLGK